MRERQAFEVDARIILGGRLSPTDYKGRMPGILEEVFLTIKAKRPIYLVGAFGGCARAVIDAIEGLQRREFTWEYQSAGAYSAELRRMYLERGQTWDEYENISDFLRQCGYAGLHNGLSIDENRELSTTRSVARIVELVFLGLSRVKSKTE